MCFEHMWLLSVCGQGVYRIKVGRENLVLTAGAVQLSGAPLRRLVITEHQVAQVQGESGAAVGGERLRVITLRGAESNNVMRLRQGGDQVRGGFVAVLVAGQGDVVRLLVLVSSAGFRSGSLEVSLEDVLNTGHQLIVGQCAVICGKRNVDAIQSLVGVLARVVSGGKRVASEQLRLGGGEGAARLTQGGQQQLGQEGVQGLGGRSR